MAAGRRWGAGFEGAVGLEDDSRVRAGLSSPPSPSLARLRPTLRSGAALPFLRRVSPCFALPRILCRSCGSFRAFARALVSSRALSFVRFKRRERRREGRRRLGRACCRVRVGVVRSVPRRRTRPRGRGRALKSPSRVCEDLPSPPAPSFAARSQTSRAGSRVGPFFALSFVLPGALHPPCAPVPCTRNLTATYAPPTALTRQSARRRVPGDARP